MEKKKGFTLVEIMLVILLIGMLSITAFSMFFDTSDTFNFLSQYKPIMTTFRNTRAYAINNKDSGAIDRYGLEINANSLKIFGDVSAGVPMKYDGNDIDVESITLSEPYSLESLVPQINLPIYLYYEMGSGELNAYYLDIAEDPVLMSKKEFKRLDFKFSDGAGLARFISVFQVSGIAEEFKTQPN